MDAATVNMELAKPGITNTRKTKLTARKTTIAAPAAAAGAPLIANDVAKKTAVNVTAVGKVSAVKADASKALAGLGDDLTVYVAAPVAGGRRTRRHRSRRHRSRRHR